MNTEIPLKSYVYVWMCSILLDDWKILTLNQKKKKPLSTYASNMYNEACFCFVFEEMFSCQTIYSKKKRGKQSQ